MNGTEERKLAGYRITRQGPPEKLGPVDAWVLWSSGEETRLPHLVYHSPTGFEYGYAGSGPSDLARSIIGHAIGMKAPPPEFYQCFKFEFLARTGLRDVPEVVIRAEEIAAFFKAHGFEIQAARDNELTDSTCTACGSKLRAIEEQVSLATKLPAKCDICLEVDAERGGRRHAR